MGLFLVLEHQGIRASDFDVPFAPDTDPEQRARLVWFVVAVSFELYPVVVLVPTDAAGDALVMGAGYCGGIISDSASHSDAANRGERRSADQLREFCLVPLPAVPDSAGLSRPGNRRHIRGGSRKSDIGSRELGRPCVPRREPRGSGDRARSIFRRASADSKPSLDDELSRTASREGLE